MNAEYVRATEKVLKALANKRRIVIVLYLKKRKEVSVGAIADHLHLSFRSTSRHLAVLSGSHIVEYEQRGLLVFYSLAKDLPSLAKVVIDSF